MQRTLCGELVPVAPHRDDIVACSDGTEMRRENALADCKGNYHRTAEERHEADVEIVTGLLNDIGKSADEYTRHADYSDNYAHLVDEINWKDCVEEWCDENDYEFEVSFENWSRWDEFVEAMIDKVNGSYDCEAEYDSNEYACYTGNGCCLFSFDIGEVEEQIDINCHDELRKLHEDRRLDDVLDDVNCDVYVSRSRRREKNEKTGYYEPIGRETYMNDYGYDIDYPTFCIYTNPGGQWRFVIPAERMFELADEVFEEWDDDE